MGLGNETGEFEYISHKPHSVIFCDLFAELARQKRLKREGKFKHTAEDYMLAGNEGAMLGVLGEEYGEVCRAVNELSHLSHLRKELIQTAAVAISAVLAIDQVYAKSKS